ncbi:MAG: 3-deoxy-manno-octulosonate cytidylyltransferase [Bacteroidaceae bacterium]|jgi:3-deoxy-manno-octulosonate cytidylyltransferase (CMP-KDO synthetase)|nr:3-deoxy-manno-octulosonate cytidylyltransferase [Bacteroidaceae bacterium]MBQ5705268.1 3-deoxy-manno-octulosonate cytidylyltransferase [Bacteroidaceae bacterium]MBQ5817230.1 3-deoxy-manno-octulosonate cytidylyltransferase [Bacteroidaceae bacterium]MBR5510900.1 3-deoxy-manno-octulosonate cytidylyltransferase [Bacteroidaceae bacterium]
MKFVGIIPARYASTRFPAKVLAMLNGKTVIQRVYEQVKDCFDDLYVATDDSRIAEVVTSFGGKAIMTSEDCKNGTERCFDACCKLNIDCDVVVNVQGDEPFIQRKQIESLMACFADERTDIATLVKPFEQADGWERLSNPNSPKVVLNADNFAMYFSRSVVPYLRGVEQSEWLDNHVFYKHLGVYAYRLNVLKEITSLQQTPLEKVESLEQLRWLEHGYKIKVGVTNIETIGIDTPEDLERAKEFASSIGLCWE